METNKVNLKNFSDKQQLLLIKLSYLDFDIEKYEKMKLSREIVTISDLEELLVNLNDSYLGVDESIFKGKNINIPTQKEIIQQLRENGLGNLKIVDITKKEEIQFKAIAFEDDIGNRGLAYSGTDFSKVVQDIDDNLPLYIKESPELIECAKIFFDKNKGEYNYLYGHAVGGNMALHTYILNRNNVNRTFTINATAIEKEPNKIDSPEMQKALGNVEKNFWYRTGGAYLGEYEEALDLYEYNIGYIPSVKFSDSLLGNLIPDCILFKEYSDIIELEGRIPVEEYNINDFFIFIPKEEANMGCKQVPKRRIENQQQNENSKVDLKIKRIINEVKKISKHIIEVTQRFIKSVYEKKEVLGTDENNFKNDNSNKFKEKYKIDDIFFGNEENTIDEQSIKGSVKSDKERDED